MRQTLYGLVLTGGQSKRMKKDKSLLKFHGPTQVEYCFNLLSHFCAKVFISNRQAQSKLAGHRGCPQIHDAPPFSGQGPLAGILSAMKKYPETAWLVLACDLPYVNDQTLARLLAKRNRRKMATAYRSVHDGLPEPLCAIYEARGRNRLLKFFKAGCFCPRKIMINSSVELLRPVNKSALDNVNDPKEYKKAIKKIKHDG